MVKLGGIFAIEESIVLFPKNFSHFTSKHIGVRDSSTIVGIDFAVNKCWWSKPKASRCIFCGTWPDFFIVHFMEYNRDVDVGEQDINRPSWHLTKKDLQVSFFYEFEWLTLWLGIWVLSQKDNNYHCVFILSGLRNFIEWSVLLLNKDNILI